MDYIEVYKEHVVYSMANDIIFTIQQNSIRFEILKPIAVYIEGKYLGTYKVADKEVFKVKDISRIHSLQFFGCRKPQGIIELKKLPVKGIMSNNTDMAIIALHKWKYEEKYVN